MIKFLYPVNGVIKPMMFCSYFFFMMMLLMAHPSIAEDRYVASSGKFSCKMPVSEYFGGKVDETDWGVKFMDDTCKIYGIEITLISEVGLEDKDNLAEVDFKKVLTEFYLPHTILRAIPEATVEGQEWFNDIQGGLLYTQMYLPGGSVCMASQNGNGLNRLDDRRGIAIFTHDDQIWFVTVGGNMDLSSTTGKADFKNDHPDDIKQRILDFVNSIAFE